MKLRRPWTETIEKRICLWIKKRENGWRPGLETRGWKAENAEDFLGLSKEESDCIDLKIALRQRVAEERRKRNVSQVQLAKRLKTDLSRISRMEKGDPSVSADMLLNSLIALGVPPKNILSDRICEHR